MSADKADSAGGTDAVVPHRSGFACFVGRPNAGKSTLTNALVGAKVAITSSRPQTTRHTIRGVITVPDAQLVLVDTPGLHKPRTLLGQRLNDLVRSTWSEVDVIGICLPADQTAGPGDRFIISEIAAIKPRRVVVIVTKTDLASRDEVMLALARAQQICTEAGLDVADYVPVSAVDGAGLPELTEVLIQGLPEGPALYPDGVVSDEPEQMLVAELIREAALEGVQQELPHSIAVEIDQMGLREGRPAERPLMDVYATIVVERSSQKPIIVGKGGSRLKQIGSDARTQIEALLGTPTYLNLHVKVIKEWQRDPKALRRLGF